MFDAYPQPDDYIPNNRPRPRKEFKLDIMTGETASHTFDVPFDVEADCQEVEVLYKLGLKIVLNKNSSELEIQPMTKECCGKQIQYTSIICHLSAQETLLFNNQVLNTRVQLRFTMNDGSITYSEIYPVKVVDSLNGEEVPPVPPMVVTGFGWTED